MTLHAWLTARELEPLRKHLAGRHDQLAHGRRGGKPGKGETRRAQIERGRAEYQRALARITPERKAKGGAVTRPGTVGVAIPGDVRIVVHHDTPYRPGRDGQGAVRQISRSRHHHRRTLARHRRTPLHQDRRHRPLPARSNRRLARRPRNQQPPHTNPPARTTPTQEPPVKFLGTTSDDDYVTNGAVVGGHVANLTTRTRKRRINL